MAIDRKITSRQILRGLAHNLMTPNTRLKTDEENLLESFKEAVENKFSTMMVHIAEGKLVFIEVSKKVRF